MSNSKALHSHNVLLPSQLSISRYFFNQSKQAVYPPNSNSQPLIQKNIYFCFVDYTKAFDCVGHNKLWKILKEMGIPGQLTCLLRNLMHVKKQQLEPEEEQWTDSKLWKEYVKAIYCHPASLTSMQSVCVCVCMCVCVFAQCDLTSWTVSCKASVSMGYFRYSYTRVHCHSLLQGIFPTQGSNLGLLPCRQILYPLSHQGSPLYRVHEAKCQAGWSTSWNQDYGEKYQ